MQILVVVAIIQMKPLKTDVEKGSMSTVIVHGLVDPKEPEKSNLARYCPGVVSAASNISCSNRQSG